MSLLGRDDCGFVRLRENPVSEPEAQSLLNELGMVRWVLEKHPCAEDHGSRRNSNVKQTRKEARLKQVVSRMPM